jgi:hypothetical protein
MRREDALRLKALRVQIKAGLDALERVDFTEVAEAALDDCLERLARLGKGGTDPDGAIPALTAGPGGSRAYPRYECGTMGDRRSAALRGDACGSYERGVGRSRRFNHASAG